MMSNGNAIRLLPLSEGLLGVLINLRQIVVVLGGRSLPGGLLLAGLGLLLLSHAPLSGTTACKGRNG